MRTDKVKNKKPLVFSAKQLLHLYLQGVSDFAFIDNVIKELEKSPNGHTVEIYGLSFKKTANENIEIEVSKKGNEYPAVAQKLLLELVKMLSAKKTAFDLSTMEV